MVTIDDVAAAYHLLLGRAPESEQAIRAHLDCVDLAELRRRFMASAEFHQQMAAALSAAPSPIGRFRLAPPLSVDVEVSERDMTRLLQFVQSAWEELGRVAPHWSVITADVFRPETLGENIDAFYSGGAVSAQAYDAALARARIEHVVAGTCLELGCGVGRITGYLARRFERVIGVDISAAHLAYAKQHIADLGLSNVDFRHVNAPASLAELGAIDTFFSLIVLQHNPPPVIHALLAQVFAQLRIGGLAFFQVPVYADGYGFAISRYLAEHEGKMLGMEMHILPQRDLFDLLRASGMQVIEVSEDNETGSPTYLSVTVLARKISGNPLMAN
jgi:SAM-dependent methyltransferase